MSTDNEVNHPKHYNTGKIEVIEFIEDKELGFHLGNAVKYICRAGRKNPEKYVQDLEKAIWYIRREIELKEANPRRPNEMNCEHKTVNWSTEINAPSQCRDCGLILTK